jgi:ubiquinone/menaquinone biosynthesis C-methylase UbiE
MDSGATKARDYPFWCRRVGDIKLESMIRGKGMIEFQENSLKAKVGQYWQANPCGIKVTKKPAYTAEWSEEIEEGRYAREPFVHAFAQFTRWRGRRVLEIGCGAGTDCLQFARAGAETYAIDLTERAVEITHKRLDINGLSANISMADAEALPFEDNIFDLVYSWGVLHHTPNTQKAIAEVYRVLKPGGRIVFMLYHKRSIIAYRLYLRYGLRAGRPFRKLADILANHMESPGTKAYILPELRWMFSQFSNLLLQPVLTPYDIERFPNWSRPWFPNACGWFVVIRGSK